MTDREAPSPPSASPAPETGVRLAELAELVGGRVEGDPDLRITAIRTLELAEPGELSFVRRASLRDEALKSRASAILCDPGFGELPQSRLVVDNPSLALARLIAHFHPRKRPAPGVHETAVLGKGSEIDPSATIGPYAVVGEGCRIGARCEIGAHVVLGPGCHLGEEVFLHPHVVLYDGVELGDRVELHAGVILGADGFGYVFHQGEHVKIPQVGNVKIEDDVEIGALSAVDRAVLETTRIGSGSKIDNLCQVGHNVEMGRGCMLCGQSGVAGSARLGNYVVIGGQSGVVGHIELEDGVQVAGKSVPMQSVETGKKVAGIPAVDLKKWRRQSLLVGRLGEMRQQLRTLEKDIKRLLRLVCDDEKPQTGT